MFQAATANPNPFTEAKVDTKNPSRGPLLIISGEKDKTVPLALTKAAFRRQRRNPGLTAITRVPKRGHSLTIDSGWQEVAQIAVDFIARHRDPSRIGTRDRLTRSQRRTHDYPNRREEGRP